MAFEWDLAKEAANLAKHGLSFTAAARIFNGPVIEAPDTRRDYGERRLIAVGAIGLDVLTVVTTWRGDQRRIISARKANAQEREAYRQVFHRG